MMTYWFESYKYNLAETRKYYAEAKKTNDRFYWGMWHLHMKLCRIDKNAVLRHMGYYSA